MPLKDLVNVRAPFFASPGRRIVVCAVLWGWAVLELLTGNLFWSAVTAAAAGWCTYEFFVAFDPANYQDRNDG